MNPKQFINNGICYLIDSLKVVTLFLKYFSLIIYPDYPLLPKIKFFQDRNLVIEILKIYLIVFILLFVIPVVWSYFNGQLFVDNNILTTNLFEDKENIWNYILICESYVIIGYFILVGNSNLKHKLEKSGFGSLVNIDRIDDNSKSRYGYFGFILLIVSTFIFSSGYAYDITMKSNSHIWFMDSFKPNVQYTRLGYYYFLINFALLFFVLVVGFSYFGFINKIGYISIQIKQILGNDEISQLEQNWGDESKLKKAIAPITHHMLLLQLMVTILILNVVLWNINKQGIGFNYNVTVFVLIVFGVWLFTLPRYYINYQVFKIWQKIGKHEYKNLSLPWVMGLSSIIDIILFSLLLNNLISKDFSEIVKNLIG